jgi:hypothetical protein
MIVVWFYACGVVGYVAGVVVGYVAGWYDRASVSRKEKRDHTSKQ